jgi:hypothetical protein
MIVRSSCLAITDRAGAVLIEGLMPPRSKRMSREMHCWQLLSQRAGDRIRTGDVQLGKMHVNPCRKASNSFCFNQFTQYFRFLQPRARSCEDCKISQKNVEVPRFKKRGAENCGIILNRRMAAACAISFSPDCS